MSFDRKRIVFDTSTLVSCCLTPNNVPHQALQIALQEHLVLASDATVAELAEVLSRPKFDLWREPAERHAFVAYYMAAVRRVEVTETVVACRDPKDDKFLSLAASAGASLIVSSDDDLLSMESYRGITIMKPKAFIDLSA